MVRRAGASISIVSSTELIGAKRLDAEAYQPKMLSAYAAIEHLPHVSLGEIAFITDGQHGYHTIDENSEIKHLTARSIQNGFIDTVNADRISEEMHLRNQRSACVEGDVLLSTAGTIGNSGIITKDVLPANMDQDVARIKIHNQQELNPWYLVAFLNSRYGRLQTMRESTGQVQQHLALEKVRQLRVPLLAQQNQIAEMGKRSFELFQQSEQLYTEAERLLAAELGLDRLDLSESLFNVRRVSDVLSASRMDAEYFKPKYERVLDVMRQSGKKIGDVAQLAKRRFEPMSGKPFNYIEISDLSGNGQAESQVTAGEEAPSRAQWIVRKNDVITSTVRPIRQLSAIVEPEQDGFVCSSGFAVLQPKFIEPEVLLLYLRLPVFCEIMDLYTTASMYPAISTDELLNLPIAMLKSEKIVEQLVEKVRASRQARQDAKRLLAEAKSEVERLIEG